MRIIKTVSILSALTVLLATYNVQASPSTSSQPEVGKSVLRETKPLSGTSAADSELRLPPSEIGKSAPSVAPAPVVTPEGKIISGSTNITKSETKVEQQTQQLEKSTSWCPSRRSRSCS